MTVRLINNGITSSIRRQQSQLDRLPQQAYDVFVKATPKDTGNARRSTRLQRNEIQANYAYAQPLDQGWSKQAPQGMSVPTRQFIAQRLQQIMRK